ncbi:VOC family protein [Paenibacillus nasutitermitis]|uniref:Glyoxalase n=1 Tax=Paenibacillus nasutitermitis TaxID=1652958 RepID=A0A917DQV5_9BACL|nr:VOC family protein [Paenibacillus nasutitermitis]GGD57959.1 glyoxalase [Paenibacillus nasutitermitis]
MKLNHLNLCVKDLNDATGLFQDLFGFELQDRKGDAIAVMKDEEGFTLVLSCSAAFGGENPIYPEGFHVGFYVDTKEEVDRFYDRLVGANLIQPDQGAKNIRGGYSLYFKALDGILFEITSFA